MTTQTSSRGATARASVAPARPEAQDTTWIGICFAVGALCPLWCVLPPLLRLVLTSVLAYCGLRAARRWARARPANPGVTAAGIGLSMCLLLLAVLQG